MAVPCRHALAWGLLASCLATARAISYVKPGEMFVVPQQDAPPIMPDSAPTGRCANGYSGVGGACGSGTGRCCGNNLCCGYNNQCGATADHCDATKCQYGYGRCGGASSTGGGGSMPSGGMGGATGARVVSDGYDTYDTCSSGRRKQCLATAAPGGRCGRGTCCPGSQCCSANGVCGNGRAFCNLEACLAQWSGPSSACFDPSGFGEEDDSMFKDNLCRPGDMMVPTCSYEQMSYIGGPCGPYANDRCCPPGVCCGKNGKCGVSSLYCDDGNCLAGYGSCREKGSCISISRPGGTCGNGICCPSGQCCSADGTCGTTMKHCGPGCRPTWSASDSLCRVPDNRLKCTMGQSPEGGVCGPESGKCCGAGLCCNGGVCRSSYMQCTAKGGCMPGWGSCIDDGSCNAIALPGGMCGNGVCCGDGQCCSAEGVCGTGPSNCGPGCKPTYSSSRSACYIHDPRPVCNMALGVSGEGGPCGRQNGKCCAGGMCCGADGTCGKSWYHCNPKVCQLGYGSCAVDGGKCNNYSPIGGMCGSGTCCKQGCCSAEGVCGVGAEFCDAGCVPTFSAPDSDCHIVDPTPQCNLALGYAREGDACGPVQGTCGDSDLGRCCAPGMCCGANGVCGRSWESCTNCLVGWGSCFDPNSRGDICLKNPDLPQCRQTVPTDTCKFYALPGGTCGFNGVCCSNGECCSGEGKCVKTLDQCGPMCQISYSAIDSPCYVPPKPCSAGMQYNKGDSCGPLSGKCCGGALSCSLNKTCVPNPGPGNCLTGYGAPCPPLPPGPICQGKATSGGKCGPSSGLCCPDNHCCSKDGICVPSQTPACDFCYTSYSGKGSICWQQPKPCEYGLTGDGSECGPDTGFCCKAPYCCSKSLGKCTRDPKVCSGPDCYDNYGIKCLPPGESNTTCVTQVASGGMCGFGSCCATPGHCCSEMGQCIPDSSGLCGRCNPYASNPTSICWLPPPPCSRSSNSVEGEACGAESGKCCAYGYCCSNGRCTKNPMGCSDCKTSSYGPYGSCPTCPTGASCCTSVSVPNGQCGMGKCCPSQHICLKGQCVHQSVCLTNPLACQGCDPSYSAMDTQCWVPPLPCSQGEAPAAGPCGRDSGKCCAPGYCCVAGPDGANGICTNDPRKCQQGPCIDTAGSCTHPPKCDSYSGMYGKCGNGICCSSGLACSRDGVCKATCEPLCQPAYSAPDSCCYIPIYCGNGLSGEGDVCGAVSGKCCNAGLCCSKQGICSSDASVCFGDGGGACQREFGSCPPPNFKCEDYASQVPVSGMCGPGYGCCGPDACCQATYLSPYVGVCVQGPKCSTGCIPVASGSLTNCIVQPPICSLGYSNAGEVCGAVSGKCCGPNLCCGKTGICGVGDEYCGGGCQLRFGSFCNPGSECTGPATVEVCSAEPAKMPPVCVSKPDSYLAPFGGACGLVGGKTICCPVGQACNKQTNRCGGFPADVTNCNPDYSCCSSINGIQTKDLPVVPAILPPASPAPVPATPVPVTPTPATPVPLSAQAAPWSQCGGINGCNLGAACGDNDWATCPEGFRCVRQDKWYRQCKPLDQAPKMNIPKGCDFVNGILVKDGPLATSLASSPGILAEISRVSALTDKCGWATLGMVKGSPEVNPASGALYTIKACCDKDSCCSTPNDMSTLAVCSGADREAEICPLCQQGLSGKVCGDLVPAGFGEFPPACRATKASDLSGKGGDCGGKSGKCCGPNLCCGGKNKCVAASYTEPACRKPDCQANFGACTS